MNIRRITPLAAAGIFAAAAFVPAAAAPAKPFEGSYNLTLQPDPVSYAFMTGLATEECITLNPHASDRRAIKVPGAGRLQIFLDVPDPTGRGVSHWDLYAREGGKVLARSTAVGSHKKLGIGLKSKKSITIVVCNRLGAIEGKVTYKLTPS
ncbi:MAG TPA: hypothetical protein VNA12_09050 [Mycobacteriales bacterium]|nr:hypothetical protein [Mycobacteriales bacterium]